MGPRVREDDVVGERAPRCLGKCVPSKRWRAPLNSTPAGYATTSRLMVNGENPWQIGINSIVLILICGGSVATQ